jgi:pimeloyl-ACP methyl ester carboxylesterase
MRPETRYARSGDVHIAYQAFGEGELDLVLVNGYLTHLELVWEHEPAARYLEGLASFARVINFDRRGSGLSDPVAEPPTLEERMDDVRAVMDAAGSRRAALMGISEGVSMCLLFAATHPERVRAVVSCGGMARSTADEDYPWATPADALVEASVELVGPHWGEGASIEFAAPSQAGDPDARAFFARLERATASPGMLAALVRMFLDLDVRDVVPEVNVPVLVLHRRHDALVDVRNGRWLAEHLPDARLVELPGQDHNVWYQGRDVVLGEVQEFLAGARDAPEPQRTLATVLFTDWGRLPGRLRRAGPRHPLRGEDRRAGRRDGVRVRAGVHTGECEVMGDDIGGIAVHIAARVSALAGPAEVLVSRTVKDLVAGSGIEFDDRGEHTLKGVPDTWRLYGAA